MEFLEEIKKTQEEQDNKKEKVINEIVDKFNNYLESEEFTIFLKNKIKASIEENKRSCKLNIEFWEYISGCSNTRIYCSGFYFELDNIEKYNYNGIRLKEIHKEICIQLSKILKLKLNNLGLNIISSIRRDYESRFNYYHENINIGWE